MVANVQPESLVFEFLDRLGIFIHENSLGFLDGIIVLTLVGGLWLLFHLRRSRQKGNGPRAFTAGYGIILGVSSNTKPDEPPPPLTDPMAPPSDDLRD